MLPAFLRALGARPIGNKKVDAALAALRRSGIRLPNDYVRYLGRTPALGLDAAIEQSGRMFLVNRLFGGDGPNGVFENHDNAAPRRNYVAIGGDLLGNGYLLAFRGKSRGSVWAWDHETGELLLLAPSFDEFLKRLQLQVDEEPARARSTRHERLALSVPLVQAARLSKRIEAIGNNALAVGLAELTGEGDDDGTPRRYCWVFSTTRGRAQLQAFLASELERNPALCDALVVEWLADPREPGSGRWQPVSAKPRPAARDSARKR